MAYYENLPVYKKAVELIVYMEQVVKGFSRYHKYSIGTDLRNLSRHIAVLPVGWVSRGFLRRNPTRASVNVCCPAVGVEDRSRWFTR